MSTVNRVVALVLLSTAALAGCSDDNVTGAYGANTATVRLVNATNGGLDFTSNGTVEAGNGNVGFAGTSTCLQVDANNPNLGARQSGSTTNVSPFNTSAFVGGGSYLIIASTSGTGGATTFTTLSNNFSTSGGNAGLRVFNAVPGTTFDAYVTAPGATLGTANATNVSFGTASSFFNATTGTQQQVRITNAGSSTVVTSVASQTFNAGQNSTLVVAPAAAGTTTPRTFFVTGC